MKLEKFKLSFKLGEDYFLYNCVKAQSKNIFLKNQNIVNIQINNNKLIVNIDFFLVENIFYWFESETEEYFLCNYSCLEWETSSEYQSTFQKVGFYPLSLSPYHEKRVLLSFLNYEFGKELIVSSSLKSILFNNGTLNTILSAFQKEIYFFCDNLLDENLVLPLSGGIDSRLLLDFFKDFENLYSYTHGEPDSGDVLIVKKILKKNPIKNHKFFNIERLTSDQVFRNLNSIDFFLPLERVMYPIPSDVYPEFQFTILSGLYGDVVFSNKTKKVNFSYYLNSNLEGVNFDYIDSQIIKCYSEFLISEKLALILLRCQKLTKQSLNMTQIQNDCFIPFLKNSVLSEVENCSEKFLYKKIIKKIMSKNLKFILHQTTLSHFTMPEFIRIFEKVFFKFIYKKYSKPYFSNELVSRYNVDNFKNQR